MSGHFRTGNGTAVYNYGLWNALDDEGYGYDFGNGSTFNNYGTFRKSAGRANLTTTHDQRVVQSTGGRD